MAVISGQRTTENVSSTQRAIDLAKPILLLEPEAAPLTVLTKSIENGGNVRSCDDFEYSWMEDERDTRTAKINHGEEYSTEATELETTNGEVFYKAALVKIPRTGEIVFVKSVATNKLTVTRAFAGTTAAKIKNEDVLLVIGAVAEEGDTSFEARSTNPTKVTNYTQIFRKSIEASGSWLSSANMTSPHDWIHQHKKKNIDHLIDIESAGLFGHKGKTTGTNGRRVSTTGGILSFYTENNQDAGGELKETEWEEWVRKLCRYGSNRKTVLASPLLLSVVNNFAVGRLQTIQADKDTTYGITVREYICAHGTIALVKHNLLEGEYSGYGIAIDMGQAAPGYRYLGGQGAPGGSRDTHLKANIQANDADTQKDEILTECGFEFKQVKTGGVLTGVTS